MPQFNAGSVGGDLDYDFSELGQPGVKGTIPEPSRFAVKKFFKDVQKTFKSLKIVPEDAPDQASPDSIADAMNAIEDEELFDRMTDGVTEALAQLCGGKRIEEGGTVRWEGGNPTYDQLSALNYRPFMAFFGYVMENLMNPESSRPATNRSPVKLTSV